MEIDKKFIEKALEYDVKIGATAEQLSFGDFAKNVCGSSIYGHGFYAGYHMAMKTIIGAVEIVGPVATALGLNAEDLGKSFSEILTLYREGVSPADAGLQLRSQLIKLMEEKEKNNELG